MKLDLGIPVAFGSVKFTVYGGPFRQYVPLTRRLIGVKMAVEIDHPCDIDIPTRDFSIPNTARMEAGVIAALSSVYMGYDIYAGCMGGIGRTGLFMGVMAKVMFDYTKQSDQDPVAYVRRHFKPHAIETSDQKDFVRNFDTTKILQFIDGKEKRSTVTVTKEIVITPWMWIKRELQSIALYFK